MGDELGTVPGPDRCEASVPLEDGRPTQTDGRAGPSPSPPSLRNPHLARPRRPHGGDRESPAHLLTSVVVITLISLEFRIQFIGACNPPTDPGRHPLNHRFLRHGPVILV